MNNTFKYKFFKKVLLSIKGLGARVMRAQKKESPSFFYLAVNRAKKLFKEPLEQIQLSVLYFGQLSFMLLAIACFISSVYFSELLDFVLGVGCVAFSYLFFSSSQLLADGYGSDWSKLYKQQNRRGKRYMKRDLKKKILGKSKYL